MLHIDFVHGGRRCRSEWTTPKTGMTPLCLIARLLDRMMEIRSEKRCIAVASPAVKSEESRVVMSVRRQVFFIAGGSKVASHGAIRQFQEGQWRIRASMEGSIRHCFFGSPDSIAELGVRCLNIESASTVASIRAMPYRACRWCNGENGYWFGCNQ